MHKFLCQVSYLDFEGELGFCFVIELFLYVNKTFLDYLDVDRIHNPALLHILLKIKVYFFYLILYLLFSIPVNFPHLFQYFD